MNEKNEFKPYIPADRVMPELTVTSIVMGMLLAVLEWGVEDEELAELAKKVARMLTKEKAPKNGEFFEA